MGTKVYLLAIFKNCISHVKVFQQTHRYTSSNKYKKTDKMNIFRFNEVNKYVIQ